MIKLLRLVMILRGVYLAQETATKPSDTALDLVKSLGQGKSFLINSFMSKENPGFKTMLFRFGDHPKIFRFGIEKQVSTELSKVITYYPSSHLNQSLVVGPVTEETAAAMMLSSKHYPPKPSNKIVDAYSGMGIVVRSEDSKQDASVEHYRTQSKKFLIDSVPPLHRKHLTLN